MSQLQMLLLAVFGVTATLGVVAGVAYLLLGRIEKKRQHELAESAQPAMQPESAMHR